MLVLQKKKNRKGSDSESDKEKDKEEQSKNKKTKNSKKSNEKTSKNNSESKSSFFKNKGKGVYFGDERDNNVENDLLREKERIKEEKLKKKLENSDSSKSSIEDSKEEKSKTNSSKKSKKKKKSKNDIKKNDIKFSVSNSSISESKSKSKDKSSDTYVPKNINEAFWGKDLDKREEEERIKKYGAKVEETDPLIDRKERIKMLPRNLRIKILEEEREKLKLKVKHNFHVVTNILHSIIRDSMTENVPFFTEYYKEKFLYKNLVFQKTNKQYSNGSDEIELSRGIIIDEGSTELFMTKQHRWAQMYKLLVFQFCRDFAQKCREEN